MSSIPDHETRSIELDRHVMVSLNCHSKRIKILWDSVLMRRVGQVQQYPWGARENVELFIETPHKPQQDIIALWLISYDHNSSRGMWVNGDRSACPLNYPIASPGDAHALINPLLIMLRRDLSTSVWEYFATQALLFCVRGQCQRRTQRMCFDRW